jgi:FkbM family methyltransferase
MTAKSGSLDFDQILSMIGRDDPVILDIGANNGWHSSLFLKHFPRATLHAFEPDSRAACDFRRRIDDHRATLHEVALSNGDGEVDFYMSDGHPPVEWGEYPDGFHMAGSIRRPKNALVDWPWLEFRRTQKVKLMKLDTWRRIHGIDHIDFIWADVQGAEGDLVDGGVETLAKTKYFYTEYSDREWYEGQVSFAVLAAKLPSFEVAEKFELDALFRNTNIVMPA